MKKTLTAVLVCVMLAALLASGCRSGNVAPSPSPSPMATPKVTVTPATTPAVPSPEVSGSPEQGGTGNGTGDNGTGTGTGSESITGFEEGKTVDLAATPEIERAVKEKYSDAKVKSATYETYQSKQAYHVVLEEAVEGSKDLYVFADGTVTPMSTKPENQ